MNSLLKRRNLIIIAGAIGLLVLFFSVFPSSYARYYAQFEESKMIGLTKEQVLSRVGKPTGIAEAEDTWFYQIGRNPGAVLLFTDGRVVQVDSPLKR